MYIEHRLQYNYSITNGYLLVVMGEVVSSKGSKNRVVQATKDVVKSKV